MNYPDIEGHIAFEYFTVLASHGRHLPWLELCVTTVTFLVWLWYCLSLGIEILRTEHVGKMSIANKYLDDQDYDIEKL